MREAEALCTSPIRGALPGRRGFCIAAAFLEIQYRAPPVRSASYEGGSDGGNIELDIFDAGVRVVMFRTSIEDAHCLAGFNYRKTLADSSYNRPFGNRPSGGGEVGEMDRRPRPQLIIVG